MSTAVGVHSGTRQTIWYFILLALASLIWSGQGIAVKVLDPHLGPIAITFLPFYVTTLLFVPLLLRMRRKNLDAANPTGKDWISFLIFGGCFGSSFYNVYCKGLMQKFQEIEILIYSYVMASLVSIPLLIWAEPVHFRSFLAFDGKSIVAFLFLALFMYGASMLLFFKALQHLDVTTASTSLYLVPVFGVLLAEFLLGERLSAAALAGAAIVLISTILVVRYDTSY